MQWNIEADRKCRAYFLRHRAPGPRTDDPEGAGREVFVLIHGIGMSHRYFIRLASPLASVLAEHGDVHLIDLPGNGRIGSPERTFFNCGKTEMVGALLDHLEVTSCTVVGHSMGVQSATELGIARPDLVKDLVLIGAAIDAQRRTVIQQALRLGVNSVVEKPLLNAVQFLDALRCGPRWYRQELAVAMAYRLEERLPLARQRVLVIRGTRDPVAGEHWSRILAETAQHGTLVQIPGKPHAVHHSAATLVGAEIFAFTRTSQEPPTARVPSGRGYFTFG